MKESMMKKSVAMAVILCSFNINGMLTTYFKKFPSVSYGRNINNLARSNYYSEEDRKKFENDNLRHWLPGKLISFEGVDGTGKTTQAKLLADYFQQEVGVPTKIIHEPGGNKFGEAICKLVKTSQIDPLSETLLLYAAFRNSYVDLISPALKRGDCVICDRFLASFYVYQMFGRGVLLKKLELLNKFCKKVTPDLAIWLDADMKHTSKRIRDRNQPEDRYDAMEKYKRNILRNGFMSFVQNDPNRFLVIDANSTEEKVFSDIIAGINTYVKKIFK